MKFLFSHGLVDGSDGWRWELVDHGKSFARGPDRPTYEASKRQAITVFKNSPLRMRELEKAIDKHDRLIRDFAKTLAQL